MFRCGVSVSVKPKTKCVLCPLCLPAICLFKKFYLKARVGERVEKERETSPLVCWVIA